jgi:hypothetical protein
MFPVLENLQLYREVDVNKAWETIRENIKISAKESLGYYEVKEPNHGLMKDVQNY